MKSFTSITLYSQIHQFCDHQSQILLRLTMLSWKSPKKLFYLLKETHNSLALQHMLPCFYGNFASFLLVTIFSTLPEVLLNVFQYIFIKLVHRCQFSDALPSITISFLKRYKYSSFLKNLIVLRGNALKTIEICTYFTENVY